MRHFTLALCFLAVADCGPLKVEHDVSGTVQVPVTINLNPAMFVPFFLADCAKRVQSEQCYDPDPTTCAACMANSMFAYLAQPQPTPSPTP